MKSKIPAKISHIVMMGDSLSDRGTLNNRYLFGFIPMRWLSGLANKSPKGRFTNGYTWSDALCAKIISRFIIDDFTQHPRSKKHLYQDSTDIADNVLHKRNVNKSIPQCDFTDTSDAVITGDYRIFNKINYGYRLNNNLRVQYQGVDFVRHYMEGGLTAHDYSWSPSKSLSRFFSRLILSTLTDQRIKLLNDDLYRAISRQQKAETLVIEWSGANDLITVNEKPSKPEVDNAIKARINNAIELIKNGYRHITLLNLPNFALTPRYQLQTTQERDEAAYYCDYFNQQLVLKCKRLQDDYPYCSIQIYDVNRLFDQLYQHPEKHGFDKVKMRVPYVDSADFYIHPNGTSPSLGYMFFDDIHPSADVHTQLAAKLYEKYNKNYLFSKPMVEAVHTTEEHIVVDKADLLACFRRKYEKMFSKNKASFFGSFYKSNIQYKTASIEDILKHALYENGYRTRQIITELQWIDDAGNIRLNIPALKNAMQNLKAEHTEQSVY
jgi:phospholipase/lecithinase/hemolysin